MPRYTHLCPLRWADMDANGHMNNAVYATYLEDTRFRMFSDLVPNDPAERLASNFVVHEQTLKFVRPLVYRDEPVTVEAWVEDVKGVSFTICCEIKDGQDVYVSSRSVLVGYDSTANRPRRFSERERTVISSFAA
ncbi:MULTISPECIES: thioesterase family protein [unclassified Streptomyces]|uniref:acyl-CoA thioesterase n=1 Tax=unclassified Streptomyces TaxID=2593676 RepID=UPI0033D18AEE